MSYDFWDRPKRPGSRFAARLCMIRAAFGLSGAEVAQRAGIELARYRALEQGIVPITAAMLMQLCGALDLPPDRFFDPD